MLIIRISLFFLKKNRKDICWQIIAGIFPSFSSQFFNIFSPHKRVTHTIFISFISHWATEPFFLFLNIVFIFFFVFLYFAFFGLIYFMRKWYEMGLILSMEKCVFSFYDPVPSVICVWFSFSLCMHFVCYFRCTSHVFFVILLPIHNESLFGH